MRRVNIRAILDDPTRRKEMCVRAILFMQAMEGIETTREQAEAAYDKIQKEKGERSTCLFARAARTVPYPT